MQEHELPPLGSDLHGFESVAKYVLAYDHATYADNDEKSKWTAVRYMALRHMMVECDRVQNTAYHQECVRKVLDWFDDSGRDHLQADVTTSLAHVSPIKPPRKQSGDMSRPPTTSQPPSVSEQLEKFKQRDLRTSHIHRIAELRDRGFAVASPRELQLSPEEDNNNQTEATLLRPAHLANAADRRVHAQYQYHTPETDAEHELNQLWLLQRQEDATNKVKHDEVESVLHKWSRGRSREEAEFLRKQESTRMMAHKQHPNLPLHVTIAEDTTNQDEYSLDPTASSISQLKHSAAPVVIKKKPSATGMRYRNPLPPNYRPSPTAISTPIANNATPPPSLNPKSPSMSRNNSAMSLGEPSVAAAKDKDNKYMPFTASYTSVVAPDAKQAQLQRMTSKRKVKKATDLRGMLPTHSDPASMRDPELKLFHEASMERQCITAL
ncbi:hypothetical protein AaE_005928 [Aphanomyces astaci]|uniref:Uncharacterized protein n=1 Tax=Aphanomyces astaci TaxID=112090 RepID=A0A6A5AJ81_APHAT|nr:hypothetical protein AaE_005928 [Aphanomyces astaci]